MTVFLVNRSRQAALVAVAALAMTGCASRTQNKTVSPSPPLVSSFEQADAALAAQDYPLALRMLTELAELGVPEAQARLGSMYYRGTGVPEDIAKAVYWYRLAADQGNRGAQFRLGYLHYYGRGVPKDYAESVRWYRLAAEQGHAVAQVNLGHKYLRGQGVPKDFSEAIRWYRLAADQGNASAQYYLANKYRAGVGVPKDPVEAARLYRLAATQGSSRAQSRLGLMYSSGEGVAQGQHRVRSLVPACRRARICARTVQSRRTVPERRGGPKGRCRGSSLDSPRGGSGILKGPVPTRLSPLLRQGCAQGFR